MEGLRGIAVFLVFLVHYSGLIEPWIGGNTLGVLNFVREMGHLGVDLFFVLSGYLIYGTIISKPHFYPAKYAKRRIQRIYPTFLVVFAVYLFLSFLFPNESKIPQGASAASVYLLQNLLLLPGIFKIEPVITVAWSLSYEIFYYLLIPCLILLLKMKTWSTDSKIIFWLVAGVMGFLAYAFFGGPGRLNMFIAGILLFELFENKNWSLKKGGTVFFIVALAIFGARSIWHFNYALATSFVFVLFLLFCLSAFNPKSMDYKWLVFTPLRWLGNMSYSYYLIHGLALKFIFLIFGVLVSRETQGELMYYWLWVPCFCATLVPSFILFWIIERPLSLTRK